MSSRRSSKGGRTRWDNPTAPRGWPLASKRQAWRTRHGPGLTEDGSPEIPSGVDTPDQGACEVGTGGNVVGVGAMIGSLLFAAAHWARRANNKVPSFTLPIS